METYYEVMDVIRNYRTSPKDALETLRFYYSIRPNHEDTLGEKFADRAMDEIFCAPDMIRDDDGQILVEESIAYLKEEIDDLFYYMESAPFVRAMNRMKQIKEELMAAAWHPTRIERLLELGGEEALDNFAGL